MGKFDDTWNFYVNNYFPFMYGLYVIEVFLKPKDKFEIENVKNEYFKKSKEYFDQNNIFYEEDKLTDLLNGNINKEFGNLLQYLLPRYKDDKRVKDLHWIAVKLVKINNEELYDYEDTINTIKETRVYKLPNRNNKKRLYVSDGSFKYYDGNKQYTVDDSINDFKSVEDLGIEDESIGIIDVKVDNFKYYIVYWEHWYPYDHYITFYEAPCATFEEATWLAKKIDKILPIEIYRYRKDERSREYIFEVYREIGIRKVEEELLRHSSHQRKRRLAL